MTEVVPITWKQAVKLVAEWHRHLPRGCERAVLPFDAELRRFYAERERLEHAAPPTSGEG